MNDRQALAEARKRWGKTAAVKRDPGRSKRQNIFNGDYVVGRIGLGMFFEVKGDGTTWTAALADADMKRATEKLNYRLMDEGYRWHKPDPETEAIDQAAVESATCDSCGKGGLSYYPAGRYEYDGSSGFDQRPVEGYRAFAVCGSCGKHQELAS